jgi:acyl-CoA synthetase (AMP-forming)/AMP-acid ligase II
LLIDFAGSTGTPKGVDVSHVNVTNALLLEPASLGIRKGSKVGSVLSIAFDMGAWEILACLMNGGTLYMRGSQWEATLKEVRKNRSSYMASVRLTRLTDRYSDFHPFHLVEISKSRIPEHQNSRDRWRAVPTDASSISL